VLYYHGMEGWGDDVITSCSVVIVVRSDGGGGDGGGSRGSSVIWGVFRKGNGSRWCGQECL
jgi:hypothetical protein